MIVVVNPSGAPGGHSFKGLHDYCAHDQKSAETSERVEWIATRNIAAEDPNHAYKLMIATANAQAHLKEAAGIRAGRASKHGPVMHVVLAFAEGEPTDKDAMTKAADQLLSHLGVDPAKSRAKKGGPVRRQFADEHQVIMYAHNDTGSKHLHLMINRVHPIHGANLPTNNDQIKAQNWALKYSKEHGTDHRTKKREENHERRQDGKYVKGERRKSRNVYELEQYQKIIEKDEALLKEANAAQRSRSILAVRRTALAAIITAQKNQLANTHNKRIAAIETTTKKAVNKANHEVWEEFRDKHRALKLYQAGERKTFEALEKTFFGRLGNAVKIAKLSEQEIGHRFSKLISRSFQIMTNATKRRAHFEKAQSRAQKAVQADEKKALGQRLKSIKATQGGSLARCRAVYAEEQADLASRHRAARQKLKTRWNELDRRQEAILARAKALAEKLSPGAGQSQSLTYQQRLRERFAGAADQLRRDDQDQTQKQGGGQKLS